MIGNDVVDLHFFEPPAYQHVKYLERTCNTEEAEVIRKMPEPSKSLAVVWACKEAVYKLVSKQFAVNSFVPRHFLTEIDKRIPLEAGGRLGVNYRGLRYAVAASTTERWIHAVATFPEDQRVNWRVSATNDCGQGESEAVRALGIDLLLRCGYKDAVLEFAGRIPIVKSKTGSDAGLDISLSHHGAYASAAIAWSVHSEAPFTCKNLAQASLREDACFTCTA